MADEAFGTPQITDIELIAAGHGKPRRDVYGKWILHGYDHAGHRDVTLAWEGTLAGISAAQLGRADANVTLWRVVAFEPTELTGRHADTTLTAEQLAISVTVGGVLAAAAAAAELADHDLERVALAVAAVIGQAPAAVVWETMAQMRRHGGQVQR